MKRHAIAVGLMLISASASPAFAADVGVSIRIGEPGFYGQIDIGNMPQPRLIYERPIIIQAAPISMRPQPIYLHVPPGHAKKWSKHCGRYNACGQPVYFVNNNWYDNVYVPEYRKHKAGGKGRSKDERGRDGDDDNNNGKGKGKGHKEK